MAPLGHSDPFILCADVVLLFLVAPQVERRLGSMRFLFLFYFLVYGVESVNHVASLLGLPHLVIRKSFPALTCSLGMTQALVALSAFLTFGYNVQRVSNEIKVSPLILAVILCVGLVVLVTDHAAEALIGGLLTGFIASAITLPWDVGRLVLALQMDWMRKLPGYIWA